MAALSRKVFIATECRSLEWLRHCTLQRQSSPTEGSRWPVPRTSPLCKALNLVDAALDHFRLDGLQRAR